MDRNAENEYRRYTAVLKEAVKGYAITPTKRPRGKVVIEINGHRGTMKCTVKNLRAVGNHKFAVLLVSEEQDNRFPVFTGNIAISKEGVGERTCTFDSNSVKGTGMDIDSFNAVEICAYTAYSVQHEDRVLNGQLELEEVNLPEEPKMEKVSPFGGGLPYYQWWKFYPGFFHNLMYQPTVPIDVNSYRPAGMNDSGLSIPKVKGFDNSFASPVSSQCAEIFNGFQTGPVFQGHQLVGLQYDDKGAVKYLVHGIPGRFCSRDQPYGGATGYVYWHPLPGQKYNAGEYGYWLVHINPVSGEVVFPQKPTKPPDCDNCDRVVSD